MPRGGPRPNSGGKRPGAGRKRGSKTRPLMERVVERELLSGRTTPLQMMLKNMDFFDAEAAKLLADILKMPTTNAKERHHQLQLLKQLLGTREQAQICARDAAPYMHARLTAIDVGNKNNQPFELVIKGADAKL